MKKWTSINESLEASRISSDMLESIDVLEAHVSTTEAISFAAESKYIAEDLYRDILAYNTKAEEMNYNCQEYITEATSTGGVFKKIIDFIIRVFKSLVSFIKNMFSKIGAGASNVKNRASDLMQKLLDGTITEAPSDNKLKPIPMMAGNVRTIIDEVIDIGRATNLFTKHNYYKNVVDKNKNVNATVILNNIQDEYEDLLYAARFKFMGAGIRSLFNEKEEMAALPRTLSVLEKMWRDLDKSSSTTDIHERGKHEVWQKRADMVSGSSMPKQIMGLVALLPTKLPGFHRFNRDKVESMFVADTGGDDVSSMIKYFMTQYENSKKEFTISNPKFSDVCDALKMDAMRMQNILKYGIIDDIVNAANTLESLNKRIEVLNKSVDVDGVGVNPHMTAINGTMNTLKDLAASYQVVITTLIQSFNGMISDIYMRSVNSFNMIIQNGGFVGIAGANKKASKEEMNK